MPTTLVEKDAGHVWQVIQAVWCARALALYELTWWYRSGVAKGLVGLGMSVVLLSVSAIVGQADGGKAQYSKPMT